MKNSLYNMFRDKRIVEIESHLKTLGIDKKNYTINDDYTVDVNKSVIINNKKMKSCPVDFKQIIGNFIWIDSDLSNVNGLPSIIRGNLILSGNKLKNLIKVQGKFDIIEGGIILQNNKLLRSLYGLPDKCRFLDVSNCSLENLIGSPRTIYEYFNVSFNKLTTIKYCPESIGGLFDFSNNDVSIIDQLPRKFGMVKYENNPIIDYGPLKDDKVLIKSDDINKDLPDEKIQNKQLDIPFDNDSKEFNKTVPLKNVQRPVIDDFVMFIKPDSKYNNFKGQVVQIFPEGYKVDFSYNDNKDLWDKANIITRNDLRLIKIKPEELIILDKKNNNNGNDDILKVGDKITYTLENDYLDGWEGEITRIYGGTFDIKLYKDNQTRYLYNVSKFKFKKSNQVTESDDIEEKILKNEFKKGDPIIYFNEDKKDINHEYHLRRGEINYVNTYASDSGTYDIKLYKIEEAYDKYIYRVKMQNLLPVYDKYEIGNKVIYVNKNDDFNGKIGIITDYNKGSYKIYFNNNDSPIIIIDVPVEMIAKYEKEIGTEASVGDIVIYTKFDSKHFKCKGVVLDYRENDDKPYLVEITTRNGTKVKIKTRDENLDVVEQIKVFKKNDIIRFIDESSPYYGYIGKVIDKKDYKYNIELKNLKNDIIYLLTEPENLILLEESQDKTLKINGTVRYLNPESKYNNKVGIYLGERIKDDKKFNVVRFETPKSFVNVFIDQGTLEPVNETPTVYDYKPSSNVVVKKKKKKEKVEEYKPILVYNRRNIAKKKYVNKNNSREEEI